MLRSYLCPKLLSRQKWALKWPVRLPLRRRVSILMRWIDINLEKDASFYQLEGLLKLLRQPRLSSTNSLTTLGALDQASSTWNVPLKAGSLRAAADTLPGHVDFKLAEQGDLKTCPKSDMLLFATDIVLR
jgi:hypothetical protein